MAVFARSFDVEALKEWDAVSASNAVRSLFARWALPGQRSTPEAPLRLGLRDNYLNLYVKGQSVAKLSCGQDGPRLSVHKAYVAGRRRQPGNGERPIEGYQDYDAGSLADSSVAGLVPGWIETAETYASAEKRFVDDLVAANPGVIDLEMGLPASDVRGSERVAPRMDLVIAQLVAGESPSIAFWEAKCANNRELRSREEFKELDAGGFAGPKVLKQVGKYVRWMEERGRIAQVQQAYRNSAAILLDLYSLFRGNRLEEPECVGIWRSLAEAEAPTVIVQPGIVIGNYWPDGHTEAIASGRMAQSAASFARNGHRDKLERNGVLVHEVLSKHEGSALPLLPTVPVSA